MNLCGNQLWQETIFKKNFHHLPKIHASAERQQAGTAKEMSRRLNSRLFAENIAITAG